jgi:hypothetical protein
VGWGGGGLKSIASLATDIFCSLFDKCMCQFHNHNFFVFSSGLSAFNLFPKNRQYYFYYDVVP